MSHPSRYFNERPLATNLYHHALFEALRLNLFRF
jgi:hypothetical protein